MAAESGNIGDLLKYQGRVSPSESDEIKPEPRSSVRHHLPDSVIKHYYNRQDSGLNRKPLSLLFGETRLPTLASEDVPDDDLKDPGYRPKSGDSHFGGIPGKPRMVRFLQQQRSDSTGSDEAELGTFGDIPVFSVPYSRSRRHTLANVR